VQVRRPRRRYGPPEGSVSRRIGLRACGAAVAIAALSSACSSTVASSTAAGGRISVLAAENEYGNVASQIGGGYVRVNSVESDPNTDPHTYEVSPSVAGEVSAAQLTIRNGVGYDDFMSRLESASPRAGRVDIDVQHLLGYPDDTPNPHLWYSPTTMPAVARAIATDLAKLDPAHGAYFRANASRFVASLQPWMQAIAQFKAAYGGTPVATTEPVADYMLQAIGADNLTPFAFQADVMNGVDPAPQDISLVSGFFSQHKVKALVYNEQVTDALTQSFISDAHKAGIPVVGVYETMPTPGYTYQSWMLAEVHALYRAVANGVSTVRL
jgi:zinc/manganese transport system substrate-binding protein